MQFIAIVLLCIVAAIAYGIVHDQITARVCVEYFTVGHPIIIPTEDPTILGLLWGVIATWWAGLMLGVPLAVAARAGRRPKRNAAALARPILVLLGVMACCALLASVVGWMLTSFGAIRLARPMAEHIPPERHALFLADGFAHTASYAVGFFGGLIVIAWVWHDRGREARRPSSPAASSSRAANAS